MIRTGHDQNTTIASEQSQIAIIGVDRHIGRSIAEGCRSRGMEIVLLGTYTGDGAAPSPQALLSLTAEALSDFDAVVDAAGENYCSEMPPLPPWC